MQYLAKLHLWPPQLWSRTIYSLFKHHMTRWVMVLSQELQDFSWWLDTLNIRECSFNLSPLILLITDIRNRLEHPVETPSDARLMVSESSEALLEFLGTKGCQARLHSFPACSSELCGAGADRQHIGSALYKPTRRPSIIPSCLQTLSSGNGIISMGQSW